MENRLGRTVVKHGLSQSVNAAQLLPWLFLGVLRMRGAKHGCDLKRMLETVFFSYLVYEVLKLLSFLLCM